MYDIIIIGAGPAGLTAAVYARRANKSVLLLDKGVFGGQITFSPKVENYPGFESVSGSELADYMVTQALNQGAEVEVETATGIELGEGGRIKTVVTEDGNRYEALSVIIATGGAPPPSGTSQRGKIHRRRHFLLCRLRRCVLPGQDRSPHRRRQFRAPGGHFAVRDLQKSLCSAES